jgi:hypothetical protein
MGVRAGRCRSGWPSGCRWRRRCWRCPPSSATCSGSGSDHRPAVGGTGDGLEHLGRPRRRAVARARGLLRRRRVHGDAALPAARHQPLARHAGGRRAGRGAGRGHRRDHPPPARAVLRAGDAGLRHRRPHRGRELARPDPRRRRPAPAVRRRGARTCCSPASRPTGTSAGPAGADAGRHGGDPALALGYYLVALREDEDAARSLGVRVVRCKVAASAISAALTACAGTVLRHLHPVHRPLSTTQFEISVQIALVAIVGGLGTTLGPASGRWWWCRSARSCAPGSAAGRR